MSYPLISIITVCLNSEKTIQQTINSVYQQTYENYEYIIKDGGSTDRTKEIVLKNEPRFKGRLRFISQNDNGMYDAMNQGISMCGGNIIGIINSDDYYASDTLTHVAELYSASKNPLVVIIGDMQRVSSTGEIVYHYRFTQDMVKKKACFGHPAMFAAKAVYDKIGLYDTSYELAADGDWQYRAMEDESVSVVLSSYVFTNMRAGGASDNRKYRWKWFRERSKMQLEHHRGTPQKIYWEEFKKVIRNDIKNLIPQKYHSIAYQYCYSKRKE